MSRAGETITAGRTRFELPSDTAALLSNADSKRGRIQRAVLALMHEHRLDGMIPTSGRFAFYELEQRGLATKDGGTDTRRSLGWPPGAQDITDALTYLRENMVIPWAWIWDESRSVTEWRSADTILDYVRDLLADAALNPWGEPAPLIICESRATAGVLRSLAGEYLCQITGTGGQVAGFLYTNVAPRLRDNNRRVLYLGDLDLSGGQIEENTRRVL
jgi:hypothetical protein